VIPVDTNVLVAAARTRGGVLRSIAAGELERAVLTVADVARMAELAERYANLGLGGTDASLVALAERLDLTTLATFDRRHFTVCASRTYPELHPPARLTPCRRPLGVRSRLGELARVKPHVSIGRPSETLGSRATAQQPV